MRKFFYFYSIWNNVKITFLRAESCWSYISLFPAVDILTKFLIISFLREKCFRKKEKERKRFARWHMSLLQTTYLPTWHNLVLGSRLLLLLQIRKIQTTTKNIPKIQNNKLELFYCVIEWLTTVPISELKII
jgi:hypothetical protein